MAISYNRMWKLLVDKKMSKADLRKAADIAPNTMTKLRRDEPVNLAILGRICDVLNCDYGDLCNMCRRRKYMTNKQLKNLKDTLWTTADQLRANSGLKSTEYAEPILGLIFLRFADVKYSKFEPEIKAEFDSNKGTRMERPIHEIAIEKCGFYLPEEARYDWLLNLPESEDLAKKVKEAMEAVEKYTAELEDTLPKDIYYSVNSEDDPLVLAKLLKNFKDIPADVELDIFGEIYEYFLGEFALAEGQGRR